MMIKILREPKQEAENMNFKTKYIRNHHYYIPDQNTNLLFVIT